MPGQGASDLWHYTPSLPAAIILTTAFVALTVGHLGFRILYKTGPVIPMAIGGLCEFQRYTLLYLSNVVKRS